jgi:hypothetical protein
MRWVVIVSAALSVSPALAAPTPARPGAGPSTQDQQADERKP